MPIPKDVDITGILTAGLQDPAKGALALTDALAAAENERQEAIRVMRGTYQPVYTDAGTQIPAFGDPASPIVGGPAQPGTPPPSVPGMNGSIDQVTGGGQAGTVTGGGGSTPSSGGNGVDGGGLDQVPGGGSTGSVGGAGVVAPAGTDAAGYVAPAAIGRRWCRRGRVRHGRNQRARQRRRVRVRYGSRPGCGHDARWVRAVRIDAARRFRRARPVRRGSRRDGQTQRCHRRGSRVGHRNGLSRAWRDRRRRRPIWFHDHRRPGGIRR